MNSVRTEDLIEGWIRTGVGTHARTPITRHPFFGGWSAPNEWFPLIALALAVLVVVVNVVHDIVVVDVLVVVDVVVLCTRNGTDKNLNDAKHPEEGTRQARSRGATSREPRTTTIVLTPHSTAQCTDDTIFCNPPDTIINKPPPNITKVNIEHHQVNVRKLF